MFNYRDPMGTRKNEKRGINQLVVELDRRARKDGRGRRQAYRNNFKGGKSREQEIGWKGTRVETGYSLSPYRSRRRGVLIESTGTPRGRRQRPTLIVAEKGFYHGKGRHGRIKIKGGVGSSISVGGRSGVQGRNTGIAQSIRLRGGETCCKKKRGNYLYLLRPCRK